VGKSDPKDKSFDIPKRLVWEAYKSVKANKGAAGVDGQSIEAFETDLENNLYRIWNRMSSGTYFPPPVRAVEIPKPHGGGGQEFSEFPLSETESRKQWWRYNCCRVWSRSFMTIRTGTGLGVRR
jgi:retron-type reverse transcriptase